MLATIIRFPHNWQYGTVTITRMLDETRDDLDTDFAISSFGLPCTWSAKVTQELEGLEALPDHPQRKDLTDLPFVTIDGKDARDFDDAVCVRALTKGWTLWVAIADVAHYVRPGSALDQEARRRGTSVYFPNRVIPMLPPELSEDLCSLRPDTERKVVVCELQLDTEGKTRSAKFYLARIQSQSRMTYSLVNQILFEKNVSVRTSHARLSQALDPMCALYLKLATQRQQRGALDFSDIECRFKFDAQGKVTGLQPLQRLDSHRMIEEFMIAANISAARFIEKHASCGLYRVHDAPQEEKLNTLRTLVARLGFPFSESNLVQPRDCANFLEEIRGSHHQILMERALLRTQSLSVYSPDNIGHFGLALNHYTHFTSPIRRYPDLCVHRMIRRIISPEKANGSPPSHPRVKDLGQHCSDMERRATKAVWDVEAALKCRLIEPYIGQICRGTISTITSFGMFVELEDFYTEGLIHVRNLSDYYRHDPDTQSLTGNRSGNIWHCGQQLDVTIVSVDVRERKIDLHPA